MFKSLSRAVLIVAVVAISGFASANPAAHGDPAPENTAAITKVELCIGAAHPRAGCVQLEFSGEKHCANFRNDYGYLFENVKAAVVPKDVLCLLYQKFDCEAAGAKEGGKYDELYLPEGTHDLTRVEDGNGRFVDYSDWASSVTCYNV
ncbi:hypothetical protein R3P38DRAFT_2901314 [Favolaschia claudopus]|uniref:Uncharacterized protein n=1 Tax=Favolaschia claudopus TaxID=2862362 RepID=A0AAW0CKU0_9AGAR